jgi:hypothetical protein
MSVVIRAVLSVTVAVAAVVAVARLAGTVAELTGGIVAFVAMLVFSRSIMELAAAPGEDPPDRSDRTG